MRKTYLLLLLAGVIFAGCSKKAEVPTDFKSEKDLPSIFPDYTEVTIPYNIAPLNFKMDGYNEVVARITDGSGNEGIYGKDNKVQIPLDEWSEMLNQSRGKSLKVEVYGKKDNQWYGFKSFNIYVAEEAIDEYISYRLINPSYVAYEELQLCERNLTNFDARDFYNNRLIQREDSGQCINCHSYQNYHTDNMQFHMRQYKGGTMIVYKGELRKLNLKTPKTISAGVYPSWHPTLPLIAYSTNSTGQSFHTKDKAKIEVQDSESDLILYDVENNEVSIIENDSTEFEVFPWWSPDGNTLYYCSAHFEFNDTLDTQTSSTAGELVDAADPNKKKLQQHQSQTIQRYKEIRYNIYKKAFNRKLKKFGARELVFDASSLSKSATLPRISPDGRYLLYGLGNWGCFHIWHPDADLWVTDLQTGEHKSLEAANSNQAESYHSWSSNGRWILFASRRDDGNYSRLYITYFDTKGNAHKAFELPQEDPDFNVLCMKSFNVPEFMVEPVKFTPQEFVQKAKEDAVPANIK